jgi:DNA-binding Lrp family transcriptional regulator
MMKAIVLIKMATGEVQAVMRDLRRLRSVTEAHMTFGPFDGIVIVEAEDLSRIGRIVYWEIQTIPGVVSTMTCLMVDVGRTVPESEAVGETGYSQR